MKLGLGCSVATTNQAAVLAGDGGEYTGPLDIVPGAVVAYGQRALSAAKLGKALFTLRRDSDDATQSFNSDPVTGEAPVSAILAWLDGANAYVALWNNQGTFGSLFDLANTGGNQPIWANNLLNGKGGIQLPTDVQSLFVDNLPTQNIALPMVIATVAGQHMNTGMESTGAGSQSVFSTTDYSFDSWLDGFSTEAGVALTTPVSGTHQYGISAGATARKFLLDGVDQTDFGYNYGHGAEAIPINGAWVLTYESAATAFEVIFISGGASDADLLAVCQNQMSWAGL